MSGSLGGKGAKDAAEDIVLITRKRLLKTNSTL